MKVKVLSFFVFALCFSQFAFGQQTTATPEKRGYLVGPGDVITAKVLGESQFDFVATVDEDGRFQVPFFEQGVVAKCRTEKELRTNVTQLLSKYLKNPQINVSVTERKSRPPVTVYGEVRTPQQVILTRESRLLELLSFSGGVTEDAGGMIQVFRTQPLMCSEESENAALIKSDTDVPSAMYSLTSVKQGREESNPIVNPGDIIVVQKASPVYITGEVNQPTGIRLPEGGLSLKQAIAMVGGVRREAKTREIKIYRLKANSKDRETIAVNYDLINKGTQKDVMLEPYDIIEVDKSKKSFAQVAFEIITGAGRQGISALSSGIGTRILY
jgi:polysaccharide export outer membrane protein